MFGPHTIVRLRGTRIVDPYNNTTLDWTAPDELAVDGCSVQPQPNQEFTDARQATEDRCSVWAPLGADVQTGDRVTWNGRVYEVVGHPENWDFPGLGHTKITMRRFEG